MKEEDVRKISGIFFPIVVTEGFSEVICCLARPNDRTIELVHYNSSVYNENSSAKAKVILDVIIQYIEGYIIAPNTEEDKDITESGVSLKSISIDQEEDSWVDQNTQIYQKSQVQSKKDPRSEQVSKSYHQR